LVAFNERKEVGNLLKGLVSMAHTEFGKQVKIVRTNKGSEFKSEPMKVFYRDKGIMHQ